MHNVIRNREVQSGALLLLVAGFFLVTGRNYEFGTFDMMGPGFVPLALAFLLAILGLVLVALGLRSASSNDLDPFATFALKPTLLVLGAIGLFGLALPIVGYPVACAGLVLIGGLAAPDRRPVEVVISALIISIATTLVFIQVLGLPMPLLPEGF